MQFFDQRAQVVGLAAPLARQGAGRQYGRNALDKFALINCLMEGCLIFGGNDLCLQRRAGFFHFFDFKNLEPGRDGLLQAFRQSR
jgi:hypothetical protein